MYNAESLCCTSAFYNIVSQYYNQSKKKKKGQARAYP